MYYLQQKQSACCHIRKAGRRSALSPKGGTTFVNLALLNLQISLDVSLHYDQTNQQLEASDKFFFKESKSFCVWKGYTEGEKYPKNNNLIYTKF